jgi:hypothetical protein
MASQIKDSILLELNKSRKITGIFHLAYEVIGTHDMVWLRKKLHELEAEGKIEIETHACNKPKIIRLRMDCKNPGYLKRIANHRSR